MLSPPSYRIDDCPSWAKDWSKAEMEKFYRPPKKSVTMRLDADVLEWLKGYGKGYQTRVNLLLRHAMASAGAPARRRSR